MTWEEFKELIDKLIREQEVPSNATIYYIDTSYPCKDGSTMPDIYYNEDRNEIIIH